MAALRGKPTSQSQELEAVTARFAEHNRRMEHRRVSLPPPASGLKGTTEALRRFLDEKGAPPVKKDDEKANS